MVCIFICSTWYWAQCQVRQVILCSFYSQRHINVTQAGISQKGIYRSQRYSLVSYVTLFLVWEFIIDNWLYTKVLIGVYLIIGCTLFVQITKQKPIFMGKDVNGIVIVGVYFGFDVLKELICAGTYQFLCVIVHLVFQGFSV